MSHRHRASCHGAIGELLCEDHWYAEEEDDVSTWEPDDLTALAGMYAREPEEESADCCLDRAVDAEGGYLVYEPPKPHKCTLPKPSAYRDGAIFRTACCGKLYANSSGVWYVPTRALMRAWVKEGKLPAAEAEIPPVVIPWKRIGVWVFWLAFGSFIVWMVATTP